MKFKNILLIYPKPTIDKSPRFGFSIQLLQIANLIKKAGYNTFYLDYSYQDFVPYKFSDFLISNEIDLCLIEIDSFALKRSENIENALEILNLILAQNKKSIVFGYGCILDKSRKFPADLVIHDDPFKCIIRDIQILENYEVPHDEWNYDFDNLPFPDRKLLLSNEFFKKNSISTLIKTAEGCLNSCTFCQRKGWQKTYRAHSLEYIMNEFRLLRANGYRNVWINDENFTFDLDRAKKILIALISEGLTTEMKIAISSWTHIDNEFLKLAKEANVSVISFGIESANDKILEFYKKKIDLKETIGLFKYANSCGIYTVGNFIIGAPMETLETISMTFEYIEALEPDQVNIKILDYMIGSTLYEMLKRKEKSHYFACAENGLNNFMLDDLIKLKNGFLKEYKAKNCGRLQKKIQKFGLPYFHVENK